MCWEPHLFLGGVGHPGSVGGGQQPGQQQRGVAGADPAPLQRVQGPRHHRELRTGWLLTQPLLLLCCLR
jgi:hypothetical protein